MDLAPISVAIVALAGWAREAARTRRTAHETDSQNEGIAAGLVQQLADRISALETTVAKLQSDNQKLRDRLQTARLSQRELDRHLKETNATLGRVMVERDELRCRCERLETRLEQLERNESHE
jgi:chromosome segregation ATPase